MKNKVSFIYNPLRSKFRNTAEIREVAGTCIGSNWTPREQSRGIIPIAIEYNVWET